MTRSITTASAALTVALALTACGNTSTGTTTGTAPSTSTTASKPAAPLTGFDTKPVTVPGRADYGGQLGASGSVRVVPSEGFDRVVWTFEGKGKPAYSVEYVENPRQDGSGDPVKVAGDAALQVSVSTVSIPESTDGAMPQPTKAALGDAAAVAEATSIEGGFEGYGMTWIGVKGGKLPFRVTALKNPTRLVVDIAHKAN